jgi:hypothetical protein
MIHGYRLLTKLRCESSMSSRHMNASKKEGTVLTSFVMIAFGTLYLVHRDNGDDFLFVVDFAPVADPRSRFLRGHGCVYGVASKSVSWILALLLGVT